jgi:hypothetical protein
MTVGEFKRLLEERKVPDNVTMLNPHYNDEVEIKKFQVYIGDDLYDREQQIWPNGVLKFWS